MPNMMECMCCFDKVYPNRRPFICADCLDKLGDPVKDEISGDLFFVLPLDRRDI